MANMNTYLVPRRSLAKRRNKGILATVYFGGDSPDCSREQARLPPAELSSRLHTHAWAHRLRFLGNSLPPYPNDAKLPDYVTASKVVVQISAYEAGVSPAFQYAGYYVIEGLLPSEAGFLLT
jgi:hypothetical protein